MTKILCIFYKMANARHLRNFIVRIKENGEWVTKEAESLERVVNYFQLLLLEM